MGEYWRLLGHYNGESQNYEALAGGFQASPYQPDEKCTLKGIRVMPTSEAATSLMEGMQFRLTCTGWKPNTMHVCGAGTGLRTVPAFPLPVTDYEVNQPCEPGVPITVEGRHVVATAVTANVFVLGLFES